MQQICNTIQYNTYNTYINLKQICNTMQYNTYNTYIKYTTNMQYNTIQYIQYIHKIYNKYTIQYNTYIKYATNMQYNTIHK